MNLLVVAKPDLFQRMERHIAALMPSVVVKFIAGAAPSDYNLSDLDPALPLVVLGGSDETHDVLKWLTLQDDAMTRLRWVHSYNVGVDGLRLPELAGVLRHVPVSNARAASSYLLAEHVAMCCLYFNRYVPLRLADQKLKNWRVMSHASCHGQTLGILGYGDIGRNVARTARFGLSMNVLGVRRSSLGHCDDLGTRMLVGPDGMKELLAQSDFIVNALPLTVNTRNMVDKHFFASMKRSAVFINVGRGATVVEDDLHDALATGTIRGAALDVYQTEPLPKESKLWELGPDKTYLTSHDAAPNAHCGGVEFAMRQFATYAREFVSDHRLPPYLVDFDRGY